MALLNYTNADQFAMTSIFVETCSPLVWIDTVADEGHVVWLHLQPALFEPWGGVNNNITDYWKPWWFKTCYGCCPMTLIRGKQMQKWTNELIWILNYMRFPDPLFSLDVLHKIFSPVAWFLQFNKLLWRTFVWNKCFSCHICLDLGTVKIN